MNPIKLLRETDGKPVAVACGKCGMHWSLLHIGGEDMARVCCDAEAKREADAARHAQWDRENKERDARAIAAAARIPEAEYNGPVWWDGCDYHDGYFYTLDELREYAEDEGIPLPAEVWASVGRKLQLDDAEEWVRQAADDHHEDILDFVPNLAPLQAAVDAWNASVPDSASTYEIDYRRRVVLDACSVARTIVEEA